MYTRACVCSDQVTHSKNPMYRPIRRTSAARWKIAGRSGPDVADAETNASAGATAMATRAEAQALEPKPWAEALAQQGSKLEHTKAHGTEEPASLDDSRCRGDAQQLKLAAAPLRTANGQQRLCSFNTRGA
jgi:hypothetical protein